MNTLVYRYGLRAPHENRDLALSELRTAHEYRNKLIEIECARRKRVRAAEDALLGKPRLKLAEAQGALDAAIETVSKHRAGTRKRATPAEMLETLKAAREAQHVASKALPGSGLL